MQKLELFRGHGVHENHLKWTAGTATNPEINTMRASSVTNIVLTGTDLIKIKGGTDAASIDFATGMTREQSEGILERIRAFCYGENVYIYESITGA